MSTGYSYLHESVLVRALPTAQIQQTCLTHSCEKILPEAFGVLYDVELIRYQNASSDVNAHTLS